MATRRCVVLAICCISVLISGMDVSVVNIGLPSIRRDFHASLPSLQWATAAYTMALASLLMLGGSTADRIGRARVFRIGLALFTVASFACSVAPGIGWLIGFRALQGAGGSMLNPVAMSIIRNTFSDPRERAHAIGIWGATVGASMALGPIFGGLLVGVSWRAVFLVNVPIGVVALVLARRFVPESRADHPRRIDPVGQVLVIGVLLSLTAAIIEGPGLGWGSSQIVALLVIVVAALILLVVYELQRREPLIDPRFFRSRPFAAANVMAVAMFSAYGGFLFLTTLYLQVVRGLSPLSAGLCSLPMAAVTLLCSPISGRVLANRGPRGPLLVGGLGLSVSGLMLVRVTATTPIGWILATFCVFGLAFASLSTPITSATVSGMPPNQAGVAAAVSSTSRQIGLTLGVAIAGAVVSRAEVGDSLAAHLAASSHPAWWLNAGIGAAIVGLALIATSAASGASAERVAARFPDVPGGPTPVAAIEETSR